MIAALAFFLVTAAAEGPGIVWPDEVLALQNRPQGLTVDAVGRRAAEASPRARSAALDAAAADADTSRARSGYLPDLTLTLRAARWSELGDQSAGRVVVAPRAPLGPLPPTGAVLVNAENQFPALNRQYLAEAALTVPLSDYLLRIGPSHAAAQKRSAAAQALAAAQRGDESAAAKLLYYDWALTKLTIGVMERLHAAAQARLTDARHRRAARAASNEDVLELEALASQAAYQVQAARNGAAVLEARLHTLLGDDSAAPYEIGEDLTRQPEAALPDEPALAAAAVEKRGTLRSLVAAADAGTLEATSARSGALPRLVAFASVIDANPNPRYVVQQDQFKTTWELGAAIVWTPSRIWASAAEADAHWLRAESVLARRQAGADAVRMEVMEAAAELKNAQAGISSATTAHAAAEESVRNKREALAAGRTTPTALLQAESRLTQAQLDTLAAFMRVRAADVRLLHAAGDDE